MFDDPNEEEEKENRRLGFSTINFEKEEKKKSLDKAERERQERIRARETDKEREAREVREAIEQERQLEAESRRAWANAPQRPLTREEFEENEIREEQKARLREEQRKQKEIQKAIKRPPIQDLAEEEMELASNVKRISAQRSGVRMRGAKLTFAQIIGHRDIYENQLSRIYQVLEDILGENEVFTINIQGEAPNPLKNDNMGRIPIRTALANLALSKKSTLDFLKNILSKEISDKILPYVDDRDKPLLHKCLACAGSFLLTCFSAKDFDLLKKSEHIVRQNTPGRSAGVVRSGIFKIQQNRFSGQKFRDVMDLIWNQISEVFDVNLSLEDEEENSNYAKSIIFKSMSFFYNDNYLTAPNQWEINLVNSLSSDRVGRGFNHFVENIDFSNYFNLRNQTASDLTRVCDTLFSTSVSPDMFLVSLCCILTFFSLVRDSNDNNRGSLLNTLLNMTFKRDQIIRASRANPNPTQKSSFSQFFTGHSVREDLNFNIFYSMISKLIEICLPEILSSGYSRLILNPELIGEYFATCGLSLRIRRNNFDLDQILTEEVQQQKINLADITFKKGLIETSNTPGTLFNQLKTDIEIRKAYWYAKELRLINHFKLPTPYLGNHVSCFFKKYFSDEICERNIFVLTTYLTEFTFSLLKTFYTDNNFGHSPISIGVQPLFLLQQDGIPLADLIELGGEEFVTPRDILNIENKLTNDEEFFYNSDREFEQQNSNLKDLILTRVYRYLDYLKQICDLINSDPFRLRNFSNMDDFFKGVTENKRLVPSKVRRDSQTVMDIEEEINENEELAEFEKSRNKGSFYPLNVKLPNSSEFDEEREEIQVESSHDTFMLITIIQKIKSQGDFQKGPRIQETNTRESNYFEDTGPSIPTMINVKAIPQFNFTVNLRNIEFSFDKKDQIFKSLVDDDLLDSRGLSNLIDPNNDKEEIKEHLKKLQEAVVEENPNQPDLANTPRIWGYLPTSEITRRIEVLNTGGKSNQIDYRLFNELRNDLFRQFRNYRLFSESKNDPLNNDNLGFIKLNNVYAKTTFFNNNSIPCSYFSLWTYFHCTSLSLYDTENKERKWHQSDIEALHYLIESEIVKREQKKHDSFDHEEKALRLFSNNSDDNDDFNIEGFLDFKKSISGFKKTFYRRRLFTSIEVFRNQKSNNTGNDLNSREESFDFLKSYENVLENELISEDAPISALSNYSLTSDKLDLVKIIGPDDFDSVNEDFLINTSSQLSNSYNLSRKIQSFSGDQSSVENFLKSEEFEDLSSKVVFRVFALELAKVTSDSMFDFFSCLGSFLTKLRRIKTDIKKRREAVVYIHETKVYLYFSEYETWNKGFISDILNIYDVNFGGAKNENSSSTQKKMLSPIVFHIRQNHVSCLSLKVSNGFLVKQARNHFKDQNLVYSVSANKPPEVKGPGHANSIVLKAKKTIEYFKELEKTPIGKLPESLSHLKTKFDRNQYFYPGEIFFVWDIESAVSEVDPGKQIPYVLVLSICKNDQFICASVKPKDKKDLEDAIKKSIVVTKIFTGLNCVKQFLDYIFKRCFFNDMSDLFRAGESQTSHLQTNFVLITFNGARYDHPLIVTELLPYNVEIIGGGLNEPRQMIVRRSYVESTIENKDSNKEQRHEDIALFFNDFCCLHPTGSLKAVAETLFPDHKELHKSEYDIGGKNIAFYEANMKDIVKYCIQDVKVLAACVLINFVNFNKIVCEIMNESGYLQENYNFKFFEIAALSTLKKPHEFDLIKQISASQWCYNVFKNYFLHFYHDANNSKPFILKGEANTKIYDIVKSTYFGGMTCVFQKEYDIKKSEGRKLNIYDINSSYPASMRKEIPYYRFKTTPEPLEITTIDLNYNTRFTSRWLYYVELMVMKSYATETFFTNPQNIFPFPVKSKLKLGKMWGTIYPMTIRNQWMWGHELETYFETLETCLPGYVFKRSQFVETFKSTLVLKPDLNSEYPESQEDQMMEEEDPKKLTIFRKYIDFFYSKKNSCKKPGNEAIAGLEVLFKLFLNSLYGKFGQREFDDTSFCYGGDELQTLAIPEVIRFSAKKCSAQPKKNPLPIFKTSTGKSYKHVGTLVRIASFITMSSRMALWREIIRATARTISMPKQVVYYGDTDSLFLDGFLRDDIVDLYEIGFFKMEDPKKDVKKQMGSRITDEELKKYIIEVGIFLAAKCYAVLNRKDGEEIYGYIKTKGVKKGALGIMDFIELEINKEITVEQLQFKRILGCVYVDPAYSKTIRLRVDKRVFNNEDLQQTSRAYIDVEEFEEVLKKLTSKI